jgi:hypothetical protein
MTKTSQMTLMSFESNDTPVTFLWKSVHVISIVLWLWYLLKIQWSGGCNKVTLLSLRFYCIVFWYITLVMSTYVWKMDPGPHMLCIRFCPQNWVWHRLAGAPSTVPCRPHPSQTVLACPRPLDWAPCSSPTRPIPSPVKLPAQARDRAQGRRWLFYVLTPGFV